MKDFHLRVGAVVLFSLFAATSGAFAATGQDSWIEYENKSKMVGDA